MASAVLERTIRNREAKELDGVFEPFEQAASYVAERYSVLLRRFPERWIAVQGNRVIASDASRDAVVRKVRERKVPSTSVYLTFLTRERQTLILHLA